MATISETLAEAFQHHQVGRLDAAERAYRQILQTAPQHPDAWHLLGLLASQAGRHEEAVTYIGRAIQASPHMAAFHNNLGLVLRQLNQLEQAIACFSRAVELSPDFVEALVNLANTLRATGRIAAAEVNYRRVLILKPDHAEMLTNLGACCQEQGKLDQAEACYRQVLNLKPSDAVTLNNLGAVLLLQKKLPEALTRLQRAVELAPTYFEAHTNLGAARMQNGDLNGALACYRRALELRPDSPWALFNVGAAWEAQGRVEEATPYFRRALQIKADYVEALTHLGIAAQVQGNTGEAAACYEQALAVKSDHVEARFERAALWLLEGDFQRGWPEFEWCWKKLMPRVSSRPQWEGQPLANKTILVHTVEIGLGDTMQFIRYAPLLRRSGARVIVECRKSMIPLLRSCPGIDTLVGPREATPPFDYYAPLMSLPAVFHTDLTSIPGEVPYLFADADLTERWRKELNTSSAQFKVGIHWQANPSANRACLRSLPLPGFEPLARLAGVQLFRLQKGDAEQLREINKSFSVIDLGSRLDEATGAFMDTAAVMKNLDLVITNDTATAHLAGALAVPVWLILPVGPNWRWLLGRNDCPWYPKMRLFRQKRFGDWASVFLEVRAALAKHLAVKETNHGDN